MDDLDFLRFRPVPVRARYDGWSPKLQRRFILDLARGLSISEAAGKLGRSRQSAYLLRSKPGAESFAAAWDSALAFSQLAQSAVHRAVGSFGFDTLLVPRFYRGRLVGYLQRDDNEAAFRLLRRLDYIAERQEPLAPGDQNFE
jgi:hypothetical protein